MSATVPGAASVVVGYAVEEWRRVAPSLWRMGLLSECDIGALCAYCTSFAMMRTVNEVLDQMSKNDQGALRGLMVKAPGGSMVNPLLWLAKNSARDAVRFGAEFGLSPASRSSISAGEEPRSRKFAGLLAG
jgi:P27 family predicted phage terminase small subunit